jgi:hypothetical protein
MGNLLSLAKRLRTVAFGGCSGAAVDLCGCDGGQVFRFGKLIIEGGHTSNSDIVPQILWQTIALVNH